MTIDSLDVTKIIFDIGRVDLITPVIADRDLFRFSVIAGGETKILKFESRMLAMISWKKIIQAMISRAQSVNKSLNQI